MGCVASEGLSADAVTRAVSPRCGGRRIQPDSPPVRSRLNASARCRVSLANVANVPGVFPVFPANLRKKNHHGFSGEGGVERRRSASFSPSAETEHGRPNDAPCKQRSFVNCRDASFVRSLLTPLERHRDEDHTGHCSVPRLKGQLQSQPYHYDTTCPMDLRENAGVLVEPVREQSREHGHRTFDKKCQTRKDEA